MERLRCGKNDVAHEFQVILRFLDQGPLPAPIQSNTHREASMINDVAGKDSWLHRQSKATEALVSLSRRWALPHGLRGADELRLTDLLAKMSPVDLAVVEGFKSEPHRKIEGHRADQYAKPLLPICLHRDSPVGMALATST